MARPKRTTPWLQQRDGIYYAHWYDANVRQTKRLSLRTADAREAEHRFAEFLLRGKEIRDVRTGRLTVARALSDYIDEHVKPKCADVERQEICEANLNQFFAATPLEDVDIEMSEKYARLRADGAIGGGTQRTPRPASNATICRELTVLHSAAVHARRRKRIDTMPVIEKPAASAHSVDEEMPYYSRDELNTIFRAAEDQSPEFGWFLRLLYLTGARRRSIENLERYQVQWDRKCIVLQKAGKKRTKKRQPIVPILSSMEPPLQALCAHGGPTRLFRTRDFYIPYKRLCVALGMEHKSHPHLMRHTRATHLLQEGKTVYTVAKLLGDNMTTVERVYGHHSPESLAADLED